MKIWTEAASPIRPARTSAGRRQRSSRQGADYAKRGASSGFSKINDAFKQRHDGADRGQE